MPKNRKRKELKQNQLFKKLFRYSPSQIILESEDHQSISESGSILAGQTRTLYLAMPILKTQADTEGTMTLFVEGNVFEIYQSQN